MLLDVAVATPLHAGALAGTLRYRHSRAVPRGSLVRVPLGRRIVAGIVVGQQMAEAAGIVGQADAVAGVVVKPVDDVLDVIEPLSEAWLSLCDFASEYYLRSLGELALSVLPPPLRSLSRVALTRRVERSRRIRAATEPAPAAAAPLPAVDSAALDLSAAQTAALAAIEVARRDRSAPGVVLLHGVTGSGKTEVYLRAAAQVLAEGGRVLVLVPEINLTPQLVDRFAAHFGAGRIATLHSGLTPAARLQQWLLAHRGGADLVLGTRLAVFASLPGLRLIVVDEEHDPSYKQQEGARYSARDLAVWRGRNEQALVILGSATPALESWQRALQGRYRLLTLAERIGGAAWPEVRLLDMGKNGARHGNAAAPAIAGELLAAIEARIARGEQSLLFLNRRGYAPVLSCGECGWLSDCPHCSAWRVFHKVDRSLRCHHCGFASPVPRACPACANPDIAPIGRGTERLEEQLASLLPGARIARIDADSTRQRGALEKSLAAVHAGEVDVLVGTQMIAKGHDFRRISLVAAINPDSTLFSSDFRAPERLFALLMQAAGRAGRDAAGGAGSEMWVQTGHPAHPLYRALQRHDYAAFAATQLGERASAGLPPFSSLALLRADAREAAAARDFLVAAAEAAAPLPETAEVLVYAPVPLAVARVADVERMQMLIEAGSRRQLHAMLRAWLPRLDALRYRAAPSGARVLRWAIDVDPLTI